MCKLYLVSTNIEFLKHELERVDMLKKYHSNHGNCSGVECFVCRNLTEDEVAINKRLDEIDPKRYIDKRMSQLGVSCW